VNIVPHVLAERRFRRLRLTPEVIAGIAFSAPNAGDCVMLVIADRSFARVPRGETPPPIALVPGAVFVERDEVGESTPERESAPLSWRQQERLL
jgi:hypothetical protein